MEDSNPLKTKITGNYSRNMDTATQSQRIEKINRAPAPWTMHEFFAGSGLVAYGLKGMFRPVWSNDICSKKAAVYEANFENAHFVLDDIKNISGRTLPQAHLSWASFPCQDLSLAGSIGGIDAKRSGLVWEWLES
jgi:DNA (cytosine-5)-methyltransferase 1